MTEQVDSEFKEKQQEWIKYPQKKIEEVRQKTVKAGQDPQQTARGYIMETVIGDDSNAFWPVFFRGFRQEDSIAAQEIILWRLGWEIGRPETPPEVKAQLQKVLAKMQESNWETKEGFDEAYQYWKENARAWLVNFRDSNPQMKKASDDYLLLEGLIKKKKEKPQ